MAPVHVGDWSGKEQRQHKRVLLRVPITCHASQTTVEGSAENVSVSGLLIRAEKTFAEGEEITLRFHLPGSSEGIECRVQVAHVVPDVFMGVEFLNLPPESFALIEKYVAAAPALQAKPR